MGTKPLDERQRRVLLRKALRAGRRANGRRRISQVALASMLGIGHGVMSEILTGAQALTPLRYAQAMRAIETLEKEVAGR